MECAPILILFAFTALFISTTQAAEPSDSGNVHVCGSLKSTQRMQDPTRTKADEANALSIDQGTQQRGFLARSALLEDMPQLQRKPKADAADAISVNQELHEHGRHAVSDLSELLPQLQEQPEADDADAISAAQDHHEHVRGEIPGGSDLEFSVDNKQIQLKTQSNAAGTNPLKSALSCRSDGHSALVQKGTHEALEMVGKLSLAVGVKVKPDDSKKGRMYQLMEKGRLGPPREVGGQDAWMVDRANGVITSVGVADGVGGWARPVDSGWYSRDLMAKVLEQSGKATLKRCWPGDPYEVLKKAHADTDSLFFGSSTRKDGSTTALIMCLDDEQVRFANVGDSQVLHLREENGKLKAYAKSMPGLARWNQPHQLQAGGDYDDRESEVPQSKVDQFDWPVEQGDVLVLGSDGLFDNVYQEAIASSVSGVIDGNAGKKRDASGNHAKQLTSLAERVASELTDLAYKASIDTKATVPFSDECVVERERREAEISELEKKMSELEKGKITELEKKQISELGGEISKLKQEMELRMPAKCEGGKPDDITAMVLFVLGHSPDVKADSNLWNLFKKPAPAEGLLAKGGRSLGM